MADEQVSAAPAASPRARGRFVPVLIVAALMGAEGIGVYLLAKALGPGPVPALAAEREEAGEADDGPGSPAFAEVPLADCRLTSARTGKLVSFRIRVSALVASADRQRMEQLAKDNQARLEDSVNTVIRGAEPKYFNEPKLDTIRRRLKHEFGQVFRDDELVKEVLIPHFLQSAPGL